MYKIILLLFYFIPFVYSYNSCVGESHSCYINDNKLYCWGNNDYGQLGIEIMIIKIFLFLLKITLKSIMWKKSYMLY